MAENIWSTFVSDTIPATTSIEGDELHLKTFLSNDSVKKASENLILNLILAI